MLPSSLFNFVNFFSFLFQEKGSLLSNYSKDIKFVKYQAACEWEKYKKEHSVEMEAFWQSSQLDRNRPMLRLVPRSCVRGGMIETYRLKFTLEENPGYKLYFFDINSLYSKVSLDNSFAVGPYKVILDKKDLNTNICWIDGEFKYRNESMKSDACHVTWLAPPNLSKPFLPFRVNNEFNFLGLCRKCVSNKLTKTCKHTSPDVRSFTSCYMVSEINYAKKLGYEILAWHEVHHYSNEAPFIKEFVKVLAAEKLRNSNILKDIPEIEQSSLCQELNKNMAFDPIYELKPETICDNTHQKQFYKDMQNSFFGRFALKEPTNSHIFCKSLREIENYACKPDTELIDLISIDDNICQIEISQPKKSKPNLNGSLYITAQINCLARQFLYDEMIKVEKQNGIILSCDTDSIIFALKEVDPNPLKISHEVGAFKHVLPNCKLLSFYSLSPRNYAILYENEKNEICHLLKVKGLSLGSENCNQLITHQVYAHFVDQNFKNNIETMYLPQMRKKFDKVSKSYSEILTGFTFSSESHVKRFLLKDSINYETFPYGFQFNYKNQKE